MNLAYDHPTGAYVGGSAIAADTADDGVELLGRVAYAGYGLRPRRGPTLDFGVTHAHYTTYRSVRRSVDLTEFYAGVATRHVSARVYYSPDYFGQGYDTVYADLGAAFRPAPKWRVFGHVGVLAPLGGRVTPFSRREHLDFSAGAAREIGGCEVSVFWSRPSPRIVYPNDRKERDALVLGVTYFF